MPSFQSSQSGGAQIVECTDGIPEMIMVVRRSRTLFTDFIAAQAKRLGLKVVVNGSFIDLSFGAQIAALAEPTDPDDSKPVGQVIQHEKLLAGTEASGKFSFAQETCGTKNYSVSLGNPKPTACAAIGGVAPIVVDGLPYGARNVYRAGAPADAPVTGDVDAKLKPFLQQKSNLMFSQLLARGKTVGKTAVGYSAAQQRLLVVVQPHGADGPDADRVRTMFVERKIENAVFLDCSDSSTLYFAGRFLVRPGSHKDHYLSVAVGFR